MPPETSPLKPSEERREYSTPPPVRPVPRPALDAAQRIARDASAYARKAAERAQYADQAARDALREAHEASVRGGALEAIERAQRAAQEAAEASYRYATQARQAAQVVTRVTNIGRPEVATAQVPRKPATTEREAELEAEVERQRRRIAELEENAAELAALPLGEEGPIEEEIAHEIEGETLVDLALKFDATLESNPAQYVSADQLPEGFPEEFRKFVGELDGGEWHRLIAEFTEMTPGEVYTMMVSPELVGEAA